METNKLPSEKNKQRLQDAHKALGSPRTYFTKKTTANVSKEKLVKEASDMLEFLVKKKSIQP